MLRIIKIALVLSVALWAILGARGNIADWKGTVGAVAAVTSMATFPGGAARFFGELFFAASDFSVQHGKRFLVGNAQGARVGAESFAEVLGGEFADTELFQVAFVHAVVDTEFQQFGVDFCESLGRHYDCGVFAICRQIDGNFELPVTDVLEDWLWILPEV